MGFHTFDADGADRLENAARRYRFCSAEELLGALALSGTEHVADLGSGTGFYTDDVAPHAGSVTAVDVQDAMHDYYREKGVPENVDLVTAEVADLPLADGALGAAFSTMTYHEFASEVALAEVRRVLGSESRFVIVDWSAGGSGEAGPPVDERYDVTDATASLEAAGFEVMSATTRSETFLVVATAP
jgi:ubiquinone/menaquinone biosynthesis C-methylase UbiE